MKLCSLDGFCWKKKKGNCIARYKCYLQRNPDKILLRKVSKGGKMRKNEEKEINLENCFE